MNSQHELEQLLTNLVVIWPAEDNSPAVIAARDYLQRQGAISVQTVVPGKLADVQKDGQFEILTEQWYSV